MSEEPESPKRLRPSNNKPVPRETTIKIMTDPANTIKHRESQQKNSIIIKEQIPADKQPSRKISKTISLTNETKPANQLVQVKPQPPSQLPKPEMTAGKDRRCTATFEPNHFLRQKTIETTKLVLKKESKKNIKNIFTSNELAVVNKIISTVDNDELKKAFSKLHVCSKEDESPLIKKIKHEVLKHRQSDMNHFSMLITHLKENYNYGKYHFLELFIFFYDYTEMNEISKDNFVEANMALMSTIRKSNGSKKIMQSTEKKIIKDIYKFLDESNSSSINIEVLNNFLKELCKESLDLNIENIFMLIDKDQKSVITPDDLETYLTPFVDFIENALSDAEEEIEPLPNDEIEFIMRSILGNRETISRKEFIEKYSRNKGIGQIRKLLIKAEDVVRLKISNMIKNGMEEDKSILKGNRGLRSRFDEIEYDEDEENYDSDLNNHQIIFSKSEEKSIVNESILNNDSNINGAPMMGGFGGFGLCLQPIHHSGSEEDEDEEEEDEEEEKKSEKHSEENSKEESSNNSLNKKYFKDTNLPIYSTKEEKESEKSSETHKSEESATSEHKTVSSKELNSSNMTDDNPKDSEGIQVVNCESIDKSEDNELYQQHQEAKSKALKEDGSSTARLRYEPITSKTATPYLSTLANNTSLQEIEIKPQSYQSELRVKPIDQNSSTILNQSFNPTGNNKKIYQRNQSKLSTQSTFNFKKQIMPQSTDIVFSISNNNFASVPVTIQTEDSILDASGYDFPHYLQVLQLRLDSCFYSVKCWDIISELNRLLKAKITQLEYKYAISLLVTMLMKYTGEINSLVKRAATENLLSLLFFYQEARSSQKLNIYFLAGIMTFLSLGNTEEKIGYSSYLIGIDIYSNLVQFLKGVLSIMYSPSQELMCTNFIESLHHFNLSSIPSIQSESEEGFVSLYLSWIFRVIDDAPSPQQPSNDDNVRRKSVEISNSINSNKNKHFIFSSTSPLLKQDINILPEAKEESITTPMLIEKIRKIIKERKERLSILSFITITDYIISLISCSLLGLLSKCQIYDCFTKMLKRMSKEKAIEMNPSQRNEIIFEIIDFLNLNKYEVVSVSFALSSTFYLFQGTKVSFI